MTETHFWSVSSESPGKPGWLQHSCSAAGKSPVQKGRKKNILNLAFHIMNFYWFAVETIDRVSQNDHVKFEIILLYLFLLRKLKNKLKARSPQNTNLTLITEHTFFLHLFIQMK